MKIIDLRLSSKKVESKVRKLRASWTRELANDISISSYHEDFEKTLTRELKRQLLKNKISKIFNNGI
jgi:hypothetical protein